MSEKLVKELNKEKQAQQKEIDGNKIVESATLLLNEAASADEDLLNKIGLNKQIKYAKELQEDANRTKIAEKIYAQDTFTGEQIKKLCLKYDLRILRADMYAGSIVVDVPRKIRAFCEKHDIIPNYNCFFILAPVESFRTVKHVPVDADPILFYRDGSDHSITSSDHVSEKDILLQIHNWGNDFTFIRRFRWLLDGYYPDSDSTSNQVRTFTLGIIFLVAIAITFFVPIIEALFVSLFVGGFICALSLTFSIYHRNRYLSELWNSDRT